MLPSTTSAKTTSDAYTCPPDKVFKVPCATVVACKKAFATVKRLDKELSLHKAATEAKTKALLEKHQADLLAKDAIAKSNLQTAAGIAQRDKQGAVLFSIVLTGTVVLVVAGIAGGFIGYHLAQAPKK